MLSAVVRTKHCCIQSLQRLLQSQLAPPSGLRAELNHSGVISV